MCSFIYWTNGTRIQIQKIIHPNTLNRYSVKKVYQLTLSWYINNFLAHLVTNSKFTKGSQNHKIGSPSSPPDMISSQRNNKASLNTILSSNSKNHTYGNGENSRLYFYSSKSSEGSDFSSKIPNIISQFWRLIIQIKAPNTGRPATVPFKNCFLQALPHPLYIGAAPVHILHLTGQ